MTPEIHSDRPPTTMHSPSATPVLITGATQGLGLATAHCLADRGHSLLLAVRDEARGARVAEELRRSHVDVDVRALDLADLADVAACAEGLIADGVRPRAIVCNAGLQVVGGSAVSRDGHELTMATNVLGHVALLSRLIPASDGDLWVVTLGSETHRGGLAAFGFPAARWVDMQTHLRPPTGAPDRFGQAGRVRYSTSKLACIALAYEIERRFGHDGVHAAAFDPGLMPATGLARDYPPAIRRLYAALVPLLVRAPGANTTEKSAQDLAWLVEHGRDAGLAGCYVAGRKAVQSSDVSVDPTIGADVWETSVHLARTRGTDR